MKFRSVTFNDIKKTDSCARIWQYYVILIFKRRKPRVTFIANHLTLTFLICSDRLFMRSKRIL